MAEVSDDKLTKEAGAPPTITLVENEDIVAGLAERRRPGQTVVAFAAETARGDELLERGRRKRRRKGVDLLAVNEVGWDKGFETDDNRLTILGPTDEMVTPSVATITTRRTRSSRRPPGRSVKSPTRCWTPCSIRAASPSRTRHGCPRTLAPSGEVDIIRYRTA